MVQTALTQDSRTTSARRRAFVRNLEGYLFAAPFIVGFLAFSLGPFVASFFLSFTNSLSSSA